MHSNPQLKSPTEGYLTPNKENLLILTLVAVQFTHMMDLVIMSPMSDMMIKALHIKIIDFSVVLASYSIAAGLAGIIGSFLFDKFDRRSVLIFLYTGFLIGTLGCGLATNYLFLLISRSIAGMFGGTLGAMIFSIVGDVIPHDRRGAATGKIMGAFALSSVIGIPIGLELAERFGWNAPFLFLTILCLIVFLMIIVFVPSINIHLKNQQLQLSVFKLLSQIPSNKNQFYAVLLVGMIMLSGFIFIPSIAPYIVNNNDYKQADVKIIYIFGGLCSLVTSIVVGKLSDKYGSKIVFIIFGLFSVVPIFLLTNMPKLPMFLTLTISSLFFIGNGGRMVPSINLVNSTIEPENRGKFMSINAVVQSIFTGFAAIIGGALIYQDENKIVHNFNVAGYLAVFLTFIAVFLASKIFIKK